MSFSKKIQTVNVSTNNGYIEISQPDSLSSEYDAVISLFPEQVDLLISWLQEAKHSLLNIEIGRGE